MYVMIYTILAWDQTIELYNNDIDFKLQILRRYT